MQKKAIIVVNLIPESVEVPDTQIENEIKNGSSIPWAKEIERVTVIEHHE